jgi:CBS domain-containing protein
VVQTIADIMTSDNLATVERNDSAGEAARRMAAAGAGDVLVLDNGKFSGILTDRDIAIRLVARDESPFTPVSETQPRNNNVRGGPAGPLVGNGVGFSLGIGGYAAVPARRSRSLAGVDPGIHDGPLEP